MLQQLFDFLVAAATLSLVLLTGVELELPTPSASPMAPTSSPSVLAASTTLYPVVRVVDGDTIKVTIDGVPKTVRLVGINTPESVDPRRPVECLGKAASQRLTEILTNQQVTLLPDPTQNNEDRYGRLLRFVFLANGTDVGEQLLKEGFAKESLYSSKPHQFREKYLAAEAAAQQAQKGLWSETACQE